MNPSQDPLAQHLGDRLRKAREDAGFNLIQFEEITGITRKTLAKWESLSDVPKRVVLGYATGTGYPEAVLRGERPFQPDDGGQVVALRPRPDQGPDQPSGTSGWIYRLAEAS